LKLNKAAAAAAVASFNYRHLWSTAINASLRPNYFNGYYSLVVARGAGAVNLIKTATTSVARSNKFISVYSYVTTRRQSSPVTLSCTQTRVLKYSQLDPLEGQYL